MENKAKNLFNAQPIKKEFQGTLVYSTNIHDFSTGKTDKAAHFY